MPKRPSPLVNCYVPLPLPTGTKDEKTGSLLLTKKDRKSTLLNRRTTGPDARETFSLRRLRLESSGIKSATGSSCVELGRTRVLALVLGPLTAASEHVPSSLPLDMDQGVLHCTVQYIPNGVAYPTSALMESLSSGGSHSHLSSSSQQQQAQTLSTGRLHSWMSAREAELAQRMSSALAAAVPLTPYPKCALVIRLTVLRDDGSVLSAALLAASLALMDAGVQVYDVVTSCSTAVLFQGNEEDGSSIAKQKPREPYVLLADPDRVEMETADAVVTLCLLPNWKQVTLWQQTGPRPLPPDVANAALKLCRDGCRTLHKLVREHLIQEQQQLEQQDDQGGMQDMVE